MLRIAAAFGIAGMLAAAVAIGEAVRSVHRTPAAAAHICLAALHLSYPRLNGPAWVLLVTAVLGVAVLATALLACVRQRSAYRRFIAGLEVVGELEGHPSVLVIADPGPQAFCAGYLRPTVYVSQATVELLSKAELDAVLAHENHHRRVRDPLRFACGRILGQALFFVPALRPLSDRYADEAELNADAAAVKASARGAAALASALLRFSHGIGPGVAGISPARVDSLLGEPVEWRLPRARISGSLAVLVGLGLVLWRTGGVASAEASLNLPVLSSRPCVAMLALLGVAGWLVVRLGRGRAPDGLRQLARVKVGG